ncbi:dephospho-CoA kinase [Flagellimonas zhangzhouensis]|uniref:Dephospho-CoA kinase n=1 Tax=Flagellimonas zhangzhouensis TaxID=1073328 RepID=A0A1H2S1F1_9FLAO|nr:dephospho-CoA kinase [Allomuricauda zhangzhouensis]SDQ69514.1 dephospho-CoA kinase [Allomuricauda zhangzhouensis]SDW25300.1 dephospho-CoA kinase [Allomuricauda zhangzhouensis]
MMIVGLTGGIGSGKSTVAKMFEELGVPVYDSDREAKQLMTTSTKVKQEIIDLLGEASYEDGTLNRKYIAGKVFTDPILLEKLNGIVHPAVREHFLEWTAAQDSPYVIQETALIFENNAQDKYDFTILVTAPLVVRLQRVMARDQVDEKAVVDRTKNQMEDGEKLKRADFHIENLDITKTEELVKALHLKLLAKASKF